MVRALCIALERREGFMGSQPLAGFWPEALVIARFYSGAPASKKPWVSRPMASIASRAIIARSVQWV
jgi:hypothetical protein